MCLPPQPKGSGTCARVFEVARSRIPKNSGGGEGGVLPTTARILGNSATLARNTQLQIKGTCRGPFSPSSADVPCFALRRWRPVGIKPKRLNAGTIWISGPSNRETSWPNFSSLERRIAVPNALLVWPRPWGLRRLRIRLGCSSDRTTTICASAGLFLQAAIREGVTVQVLIVTDGCMGYCTLADRDRIVDIRRQETYESFQVLGIPQDRVQYIGYPDGGLVPFIGRRSARAGEDGIAGYIGLQNAFTHHLRRVRPTRVYVPTHTDLHPDHRITHSELLISVFHAAGAIWPELGEPLGDPPSVGELAVYCDFVDLPNLEIIGDEEVFQTKLNSITAYKSQAQIERLVDSLRRAGPYEYVRESEFRLFTPDTYKPLFASYILADGRDAEGG